MNAEEVVETASVLERRLMLVQTGQLSAADGCRVEGAVAALRSVSGDPTLHYARSRVAASIRRLTDIRDAEPVAGEAAMTVTTEYRIEGALIALQSLTGSPSALLARFVPASRAPDVASNSGDAPWIVTYAGRPQTLQVQL